jgi:hypothetical protein
MASPEQLRANRANAARSTGPRTTEGKKAVRFNALKHGLLAQAALLPSDDEEEFQSLSNALRAAFQPVGAHEDMLVDLIVGYRWRLRRAFQVESGLFSAEIYRAQSARVRRRAREACRQQEGACEPRSTQSGAREWADGAKEADALDALADSEFTDIGEAFRTCAAANSDAFSKLSRYETTILRALFKAIDALQLEQQKRLDEGIAGGAQGVLDGHAATDSAPFR